MNIPLLRIFDRLIGILFVTLLSAFRRRDPPRDVRRVLVIKLFGLGNIVMFAPAAQTILRAFPGSKIELLTFATNGGGAAMYRSFFSRAHLIPYSIHSLVVFMIRFILGNHGRYDLVIDAEQFIRLSAMVTLFLSPRSTAGIPTRNCHKHGAYNVKSYYREDRPLPREYVDLALEIARSFGREAAPPQSLIAPDVDREASSRVRDMLKDIPHPRVVVCVGGRPDAAMKRYPLEMWRELSQKLANAYPSLNLVFTGTREETGLVRTAVEGIDRAHDISGMLTQLELVELLREVDFILSNDTGTLHLAAAVGIPCVAFFGPTDPQVYAPFAPNILVIHDPRNKVQIANVNEKSSVREIVYWPSSDEALRQIGDFLAQLFRAAEWMTAETSRAARDQL